jgi:hypothetical protein
MKNKNEVRLSIESKKYAIVEIVDVLHPMRAIDIYLTTITEQQRSGFTRVDYTPVVTVYTDLMFDDVVKKDRTIIMYNCYEFEEPSARNLEIMVYIDGSTGHDGVPEIISSIYYQLNKLLIINA